MNGSDIVSAHPLETRLVAAWPPSAWQDLTTLVAVSGGADSVALLRAMARLKTGGVGRLAVVHYNHALRGEESDADEAFVADLCRGLGLACQVGRASNISGSCAGRSQEGVARRLRYDFFRAAAERLGARYLVTAHTADDQAETILHRIVRGTGIAGMAGIARVRRLGPAVSVIRPLLAFRRTELLQYLDELGQAYRVDHTNLQPRYTRNRIRLELLPRLARDYNHAVVEALLRLGRLAGEVQQVIDGLIEPLYQRAVVAPRAGEVCIDLAQLDNPAPYLLRELLMAVWRRQGWPLRAMGYAEWEALANMAADDPGIRKQVLPGNITAERQEGDLRLRMGP